MASKVVSLDAHVHRVWTEYLAARERADETKAVADGIAAGRAWRRWLDLFTAEDQRQKMDGTSR